MITNYVRRTVPSIAPIFQRWIARPSSSNPPSSVDYDAAADETLDSLTDAFEALLDRHKLASDVTFSNGVLTVELDKHGAYVINKQTPNKQIWLSSPVSGPKRYDFVNQSWIYKYDGMSLHQLLNQELSNVFPHDGKIDFQTCAYGGQLAK